MKKSGTFKALATMILAVFLITGFITEGFASRPFQNCIEKMQKKLKEAVKYPQFAARQNMEGEIVMILYVSNEGKISAFFNSTTTDPALADYVRECIRTIQCDELAAVRDHYFKIRFHFQLI